MSYTQIVGRIGVDVVRTREFDRDAKRIWTSRELSEVIEQLAKYPDSGVHLAVGCTRHELGRRTIFLLAAYAKNEKDDLTAAELKLLRKFAESLRGTK